MSRRGENPCLVCHEVAIGPKGGVVCDECRRKVAGYDELRARAHEGAVCIRLRQWPYVPSSSGGMSKGEKADQLEKLLRELRANLDRPRTRTGYGTWPAPGETAPVFDGKPRERGLVDDRDNMGTFNVDARLAQFFLDLEPMIQHAIREAEENGKRQGSNILARLAAGELTSGEFEKQAGIVPREGSR